MKKIHESEEFYNTTCTVCFKRITYGSSTIILNIGIEGKKQEKFTGIIWHPECAPVDRKFLLDSIRK